MSTPLRDTAQAWLAAGRAAVVVEVAGFKGSVPRETGTRMLVAADAVAGTIGGGHLELQAVDAARVMLRHDEPGPREQSIALGPSLGQCCGGALRLRYVGLDRRTPWPEPSTRFALQLYGAGHVGRAIVALLSGISCRVWWIDERETEFPPPNDAAHIERVCVESVEAEVAQAPAGAYYLVLTHSHELDLRIAEAILRRGDFGWFGLIGSATKRARFEHRFDQRGIAPAVVARMVCPIGVPGVVGKEPEVIAVAVVAQLLQASSGR